MINYLILVFAFLTMVLLSFLPGLIELRRPKDPGPIDFDLDRDIDERYFSKSYRKQLESGLESLHGGKFVSDGGSVTGENILEDAVITLNKGPEAIKFSYGDYRMTSGSSYNEVIVIQGDLLTEDSCSVDGELRVEKNCKTGNNNSIKALSGFDVELGNNNTINGWVDADNTLMINNDCSVKSRATAGANIEIIGSGSFKALAAPTISIGGGDLRDLSPEPHEVDWTMELDRIVIELFDESPINVIAEKIESMVEKKIRHSSILDRAYLLGLTKEPLIELKREQKPDYLKNNKVWLQCGDTFRIKGDVEIPAGERVAGNLIVEGKLISDAEVIFEGGLHVDKLCVLGPLTKVNNSVIVGGDLKIGVNSNVKECVGASGNIRIMKGSTFGSGTLGGVASHKIVHIDTAATIHGKIYGEHVIRITTRLQ